MPDPRYAYYLAHAGQDLGFATALYRRLKEHLQVFLDQEDLLPGDDWTLLVPRAQRASQATVVLVSSRHEASYYLRDEVHVAIRLSRLEGQAYRLIPVFLDGAPRNPEDVPYGLNVLHGLDAMALGVDGVAEKLLSLAAKLPGGSSVPPASPASSRPLPAPHQLHEALCSLLDAQFEEILTFNAPGAAACIPGRTAPRSLRALDLVTWLQTQQPAIQEAFMNVVRRATQEGPT